MATPPIYPRKLFLAKSSSNVGCIDLPSSLKDSDRLEHHASKLGLSGRSQSECQIKPGPKLPWLPHSMSQSEAMDEKNKTSHNNMEEPQESNNTGSPTANQSRYLRPRPVRRPPAPPVKTSGPLLSPSPTANVYYEVVEGSTLQMAEKSLDVFGEEKPSPPPLPHPARPPRSLGMSRSSSDTSAYPGYERILPVMGLPHPQGPIEQKCQPHHPPALLKSKSLSLHGDYNDVCRTSNQSPSGINNAISPRPPRPLRPPSRCLSRSPLQPLLQVWTAGRPVEHPDSYYQTMRL
ncbi:proline-rich receptor-like protein kinase PERK9 isoform X1 [Esox lucius]|uniref:proline-rich receptor-like protein kinase PERK9 isoform X1 n=1 Tax=Esox lucius TaxID=8010 RepID=UPI001477191F|nr:proline-rich receptor-like protein kinase PERK9 isoform X1 [Esox lucius]